MRTEAAAPTEGDWTAYKALFMGPPYTGWTPERAVALLDPLARWK